MTSENLIKELCLCKTYDAFFAEFEEFRRGLNGGASQMVQMIHGLRGLPYANINLEYLFNYLCSIMNCVERYTGGGVNHLLFIEILCHIPGEAKSLDDLSRAKVLHWLFRFLSVESCQWMFFEMYPELRETDFDWDFSFMLQRREGALTERH